MEVNQVRDFADRVKKFYYYKALLCEMLMGGKAGIEGDLIAMPPEDYNPFDNLYTDSYVIGCAALDGLSSIWQPLNAPIKARTSNQKRFVSFLLHLKVDQDLERVSTPFLNYFLERQDIEGPFRQEMKNRWINNRCERESHRVYCDPIIDEIKVVYENCHRHSPIQPHLTIENIDTELAKFTYAALIYKFYRCSFVHEFRASQYAAFFNKGKQISVREFATERIDSEKVITRDEVKPQLDVGIGVLTESIRKGADAVHDLILKTQCTDIPYGSSDEIKVKTKTK
jgi:hypothetical protein